jgi:hypothetical protein
VSNPEKSHRSSTPALHLPDDATPHGDDDVAREQTPAGRGGAGERRLEPYKELELFSFPAAGEFPASAAAPAFHPWSQPCALHTDPAPAARASSGPLRSDAASPRRPAPFRLGGGAAKPDAPRVSPVAEGCLDLVESGALKFTVSTCTSLLAVLLFSPLLQMFPNLFHKGFPWSSRTSARGTRGGRTNKNSAFIVLPALSTLILMGVSGAEGKRVKYDMNYATFDGLQKLPLMGPVRAASIMAGMPYTCATSEAGTSLREQLIKRPAVGQKSVDSVLDYYEMRGCEPQQEHKQQQQQRH